MLAQLLAERLFPDPDAGGPWTILDPACGDGALLEAARDHRRGLGQASDTFVGLDADPQATATARRRLALGGGRVDVRQLDFLASLDAVEPVDRVVANPPWVRTQVMGAARTQALARRFGLSGRVDLAQAFVLAMVSVLRPGGRAAVLVPNKLLQTRGAAAFRAALRDRVRLVELIDLGDTRLFDAAVLPAIIVFERVAPTPAATPFWSIYTRPAAPRAEVVDATGFEATWGRAGCHRLPDGRVFEVRTGELVQRGPHRTWQRGGAAVDAWLARLEARTALRLGALGPVRVGVKSTADPVFVSPDWTALAPDARPELLRPLTTHHRARAFRARPHDPRRQILYPHEVVGGRRQAVSLDDHPRTRAWLEAHRARLERRTYVKAAGRPWFALWVPHDPDGWSGPKLVLRDIAPRATAWLDREGTVVNGDCYWLAPHAHVPEDHLFLALAVANSTLVDAWYDRVCNNRLYAGRRRYLAQFISEFPLPDPSSVAAAGLVAGARDLYTRLENTPEDDLLAVRGDLDRAVWAAFGLDPDAPVP